MNEHIELEIFRHIESAQKVAILKMASDTPIRVEKQAVEELREWKTALLRYTMMNVDSVTNNDEVLALESLLKETADLLITAFQMRKVKEYWLSSALPHDGLEEFKSIFMKYKTTILGFIDYKITRTRFRNTLKYYDRKEY